MSGTHGKVNFGRPCANFSRTVLKDNKRNNTASQNRRKKIETFIKICKRKHKQGKGNPRLFEQKAYLRTGSLSILFCFELYQESYTLLKHRDLLAFVIVCDMTRLGQVSSYRRKTLYLVTS